jgi:hypothetical protein
MGDLLPWKPEAPEAYDSSTLRQLLGPITTALGKVSQGTPFHCHQRHGHSSREEADCQLSTQNKQAVPSSFMARKDPSRAMVAAVGPFPDFLFLSRMCVERLGET